MGVKVVGQLHLHLHLGLWVHAELTVLVETLDTIASVSRVTSWLKDLDVLAKAPLEHALRIHIVFRNMAAVPEHTVAIFLVHPVLAPASILGLWSCGFSTHALVPIVSAPGTVCAAVVPEAREALLRESVLAKVCFLKLCLGQLGTVAFGQ